MTPRSPAIAVLGALLLSACATPQSEGPRAQAVTAQALAGDKVLARAAAAPGDWPGARWWQALGDAQLDALVDEAVAGSPTLRIARARLAQAQAYAGVAGAALEPRLDGAATVSRQRYSERGFVPPPYAGSWSDEGRMALEFGYELDFWGRNRAGLEAAVSEARAAEVDAQAARLLLTVGVANAYVEFDRQLNRLDVARAALEQRQQILALTRRRVAAGLDSQVELKQAAAAVPAAQTEVEATAERVALLRNQLAALLGKGPDRGLAIDRPRLASEQTLSLPARLPADLIGRRPDVVAQRLRAEAAAHRSDAARADFYPNVNLLAFVGLQAVGLSHLLQAGSAIAGVGPALRLPLFDGGQRQGTLSARNAEFDGAVEAYNATLTDALRDVADQVTSWRAVEAQQASQREAQAQVEEAHRLALLRYQQGLASYLTVLATEEQVLAQHRLEADLRARRLELSVGLARALGGGFQAPAPEAPADHS